MTLGIRRCLLLLSIVFPLPRIEDINELRNSGVKIMRKRQQREGFQNRKTNDITKTRACLDTMPRCSAQCTNVPFFRIYVWTELASRCKRQPIILHMDKATSGKHGRTNTYAFDDVLVLCTLRLEGTSRLPTHRRSFSHSHLCSLWTGVSS